MAYQKGGRIEAIDLNGFVTRVNRMYGVGDGNYGYGQTFIAPISTVTAGSPIQASHWSSLRTVMGQLASHQGANFILSSGATVPANTMIPAASLIAVGQPVTAHVEPPPTSDQFDIPNTISRLEIFRLAAPTVSNSILPISISRSQPWGGGASSMIYCSVDATFPSEDHARWFFNSRAVLRIESSGVAGATGSNPRDQNWRTLAFGFAFRAASWALEAAAPWTSSGAFGYHNLDDDTPYTLVDFADMTADGLGGFRITAQRLNFEGLRGGKGSGVRLSVFLTDGNTVAPDIVNAGGAITFGFRTVPTSPLVFVNPSFSVITSLDASAP